MRGSALQTVATQRLTAVNYRLLATEVMDTLQRDSRVRAELVRSIGAKADFGHMKVLADRSTMPADVAAMVHRLYSPHEVVINEDVLSFDVAAFQVDLICVPPIEYDTARDYLAFNVLGSLMGRTANRMGFKYGHSGLRYKLRDGDFLVADIPVTTKMAAAFDFLGYDYRRFTESFHALEDVFFYAASSTYFDPVAYLLQARGYRDRACYQKRQNYRFFIEWLKTTGTAAGSSAGLQREHHLQRAMSQFPDFADALKRSQEAFAGSRRRKQIFNGQIVAELTGLEGEALGQLMRRLHDAYPGGRPEFVAWLDQLQDHELAVLHAYIEDMAIDASVRTKSLHSTSD
ncbi:hypothetical protein AC611_22285 [Xanthomonas phaseoli pv. phaseoli]|nr:hypothetical protein XppCFBP6164P_11360 [Xanthomonas phaseoli pv. phaseoli]AZU32411.1 hypothetical protein AC801_21875 [Xanthomonas sp. ISO98C4]AZU15328.1 hypothetical protein AC609_22260 [Xanthomonas phaseoli pv. phaseoli]AZU28089.1 hypothetical protein AC611_22285 [Xanthomonas phaseoli pv. phaseoli]AZU36853.1 hypothetical protein AC610_22250 [Xanthomonas phaseoli pv. phaseoli]